MLPLSEPENSPVLEVPVISSPELLKRLEEAFPDKLPRLSDYSPESVLANIGKQEVIRFVRVLLDNERNTT